MPLPRRPAHVGMSEYLENKMLDYFLGGTSFVPPANWYIGLKPSSYNPTSGEYEGSETFENNYARALYANTPENWEYKDDGNAKFNTGQIRFAPAYPAPWGYITEILIWDDPEAGNLWFCYQYPPNEGIPINVGDILVIPIGALIIQAR